MFCTSANFSNPQPPTARRPTFDEKSTSSCLLEQSSYKSLLMTFMLMLEKTCHLLVTFSMPLRTLQAFFRSLFSNHFPRLMSPIWLSFFLSRSCSMDPFSRLSQFGSFSFISSETWTWYWSEMHQGLIKWPQGTLFTSLSLFQCDCS